MNPVLSLFSDIVLALCYVALIALLVFTWRKGACIRWFEWKIAIPRRLRRARRLAVIGEMRAQNVQTKLRETAWQ